MPDPNQTWWGTTAIPVGQLCRWRLGPTTLSVQRADGEWRVALETGDDPLDSTLEIGEPATADRDLLDHAAVHRFGTSEASSALHLTPLCADRAVVTRPRTPFSVPPGDAATVYISSPLWLRVEAGPRRDMLLELPIFRPSDTWFGPTPLDGELCYATRTAFRLHLEDLPARPHRATTRLHIRNPTTAPLRLERINLAVPHLPLYADAAGGLWTPDVTFERQGTDDYAPLRVDKGPPSHAPRAAEVSPARRRATDNLVVRAFGSLFSK